MVQASGGMIVLLLKRKKVVVSMTIPHMVLPIVMLPGMNLISIVKVCLNMAGTVKDVNVLEIVLVSMIIPHTVLPIVMLPGMNTV